MPCLLEQHVARHLAELRVADQHRHDMRLGGITGRPARQTHVLGALACLLWRRAPPEDCFRWRIDAVAAAAIAGGSAVVKMKPGA
jgi:hypothetical protein